MSVINITKENFDSEVIHSDKPVLLDFYADWCSPCRQLSPLIEDIGKDENSFKVCKVNVEDQRELAMAFGVENIPTLAVVKEGKIARKSVGAVSRDKIISMVKG